MMKAARGRLRQSRPAPAVIRTTLLGGVIRLDSPAYIAYKPSRARLTRAFGAQVAQLVEHMTENHGVGGSIPPLGTIYFLL